MQTILFDGRELTREAEKQGKKAVDPEDIIGIEERFYACLKKALFVNCMLCYRSD